MLYVHTLLLFVVVVVVYLRWEETHVVAMDIDVNDQVQQQMVLQVHSVHETSLVPRPPALISAGAEFCPRTN